VAVELVQTGDIVALVALSVFVLIKAKLDEDALDKLPPDGGGGKDELNKPVPVSLPPLEVSVRAEAGVGPIGPAVLDKRAEAECEEYPPIGLAA
jgi:hypothetical protein